MSMDDLNRELNQFLKLLRQFDEIIGKDWDSMQYSFKEADK